MKMAVAPIRLLTRKRRTHQVFVFTAQRGTAGQLMIGATSTRTLQWKTWKTWKTWKSGLGRDSEVRSLETTMASIFAATEPEGQKSGSFRNATFENSSQVFEQETYFFKSCVYRRVSTWRMLKGNFGCGVRI